MKEYKSGFLLINRLEGKEERSERMRKLRTVKDQEYSSMFTPGFNLPFLAAPTRERKIQSIRPPLRPCNRNIIARIYTLFLGKNRTFTLFT